jgi:hypothetical protein
MIGTLGLDVVGLISGVIRLPILSMALLLCLAPGLWLPSRRGVGSTPAARRAVVERTVRWSLIGLPYRFASILGGSCLLYAMLGDRLGLGFWLAVLVFYQLSLMMHVAECRTILSQSAGSPGGSRAER